MTGEITLSGEVLPVGGIKEKTLAAKRAGVREIIMPADNEPNVHEDLNPEMLEGSGIHFVKTIHEAIDLALQKEPVTVEAAGPTPSIGVGPSVGGERKLGICRKYRERVILRCSCLRGDEESCRSLMARKKMLPILCAAAMGSASLFVRPLGPHKAIDFFTSHLSIYAPRFGGILSIMR